MGESAEPRLPGWLRSSRGLPVERVRARVSAYVYGNILVLAAVVASNADTIMHWGAVITVAATALTTFLAHMAAHAVAEQVGHTSEESRLHVLDELRDAVPILTSGAIPILLFGLGALGVLPPSPAEIIAAVLLIARIALTGIDVERMTSDRSSGAVLWAGVVLAGVSVVIVALKVLFTH